MKIPLSSVARPTSLRLPRYARLVAAGGIILAAIMLLIFPVLIMFGGAIWSAIFDLVEVEDADRRATTNPTTTE